MGNDDSCFVCGKKGKVRELGSPVRATVVLCTCCALDMEIMSADAEREPNTPMTIEEEVSMCINSMQVA